MYNIKFLKCHNIPFTIFSYCISIKGTKTKYNFLVSTAEGTLYNAKLKSKRRIRYPRP